MAGLRRHNLVGRVFGRLTVTGPARDSADGLPQWVCACTCGDTCIAKSRSLREGDTRSCGCLRRESLARVRSEYLRKRAAA
jgi:hypothetical protein